ncbi:MAG: aminotransferase class III-fold pyridoxal phosphate-dependent enzyme [Clostridiales bacterium]|nr:aminotransferase class III-fold pyridoxal phosphate-dependent enzyme [Clostridiales bacterium]
MKILNCNYEMYNPAIVSSENCYVTDETGKKYVDFEAGVWCVSLGHKNRRINQAITDQMDIISHTGYRYSTKIVEKAAEKVLGLVGLPEGKCVFLSSGSEAVEFGVLAAKRITEKPYFLCLSNYYLSAYGVSANRNDGQWISLDLSEYNGDIAGFLQDVPFNKTGVFVFEPGNASGTVKLPPKDLIKEIENRIKDNGGLIVVDEVTTGTGRTGKWFGFQHYGIRPDIVSVGKGIGNGYPVSVVALSEQVAYILEKTGFKYAQSHQNDPLGCAVVSEVVSVIESENLIQRSAQTGAVLYRELKTVAEKFNCVKEIRGLGLMFVMEFKQNKNIPLSNIHKELFDLGYITGVNIPANLLRFYPPLTVEEAHIRDMASALGAVLQRY